MCRSLYIDVYRNSCGVKVIQKTRSKVVLSIGFGAILIISLGMMANWLSYIQESTSRIEMILVEQEEANLVFEMRESAHQRFSLLFRIALLEDAFERDDKYIDFKAYATDFIRARDKLFSMGLTESEAALWADAKQAISLGGQVQQEAIELFLEGKDDIAIELLTEKVLPSYKSVLGELTKMMDYHRADMRLAAVEAVRASENTYDLVLWFGVLIFLMGLAVAAFAVNNSTRIERELIELQKLAESASESKSLFLANMSHEIRTPLTAVIGYAEILLEDSVSETQSREYTGIILRNGRYLLDVVNDILDLSKIEANKLDVEIIGVSIFQVVSETETAMRQLAREKGLALKVNYQFPLPNIIATDPTKLKQMLLNILSNAIKFTEAGSITLNCEYVAKNSLLLFTVIDTGIGMSEEVINKIFTPFSQADASTTRKYGGTGLGLTISRQLAKMLGGDLVCDSQPGKGSRFALSIYPGLIEEKSLLSFLPDDFSDSVEAKVTKTNFVKGDVLVAEDSHDIQALVSMYLRRAGARVTVVDNGQLAIEAALANDYDLILMDIQMPVMDGVQATQWLRSTGYGGTIVALTANALKEEKSRFIAAGINDFLSKPVNRGQLDDVVRRCLPPADEEIRIELDECAVMSELIENFERGLPESMQAFSDAFEIEDAALVGQIAHRLKGMGGSFGYPEITDISREIEVLAKARDLEKAHECFKRLNEICISIVKT